ncbi:3693_t:CDS:10, partial [Ambispora leptoticha]
MAKHKHMLLAIEDLTSYIKRRALVKKNAKNIDQFIWEDIILHHGCFTALVSDRVTDFKNTIIKELLLRLNIDQCFVASYHPEANGHAERVDQNAIWAINTTVGDLGYSPFRLVYGRDAIMLIELVMESYHTYVLRSQWTTNELLEYRSLQIKGLVGDLKNVQTNRDELKWQWKEVIEVGEFGQFYLEEVDGLKLKDPIIRNRVKKLKLDGYEPDCEDRMIKERISQVYEEQSDNEEYISSEDDLSDLLLDMKVCNVGNWITWVELQNEVPGGLAHVGIIIGCTWIDDQGITCRDQIQYGMIDVMISNKFISNTNLKTIGKNYKSLTNNAVCLVIEGWRRCKVKGQGGSTKANVVKPRALWIIELYKISLLAIKLCVTIVQEELESFCWRLLFELSLVFFVGELLFAAFVVDFVIDFLLVNFVGPHVVIRPAAAIAVEGPHVVIMTNSYNNSATAIAVQGSYIVIWRYDYISSAAVQGPHIVIWLHAYICSKDPHIMFRRFAAVITVQEPHVVIGLRICDSSSAAVIAVQGPYVLIKLHDYASSARTSYNSASAIAVQGPYIVIRLYAYICNEGSHIMFRLCDCSAAVIAVQEPYVVIKLCNCNSSAKTSCSTPTFVMKDLILCLGSATAIAVQESYVVIKLYDSNSSTRTSYSDWHRLCGCDSSARTSCSVAAIAVQGPHVMIRLHGCDG